MCVTLYFSFFISSTGTGMPRRRRRRVELNLDLLLLVVLKCSTAVLNLSTTVLLAARKSRMLELLAFDKKSIFDLFCSICGDKASLALPPENKATSEFSY